MLYKYITNPNDILILGVRVDDLTGDEVMKRLKAYLFDEKFNIIFTPNPEICLKAESDEIYHKTLNSSDLNIPDGVGLKLGAEILGQKLENRLTGVDLTKKVLTFCNEQVLKRFKVLIINRLNPLSSASLIKKRLSQDYPNLLVDIIEVSSSDIETIVSQVNEIGPDIIFTALGAPHQEKLLLELKNRGIKAELGLAIGGTFDFLTGKIKRAPKWWQDLGLEWFYRLLKQPQRIGRIADATIKFPLTCYKWKERIKTTMRPNVLGVIKRGDKYLVQRNIRFGGEHWQFPQGGVDEGETAEQAVLRELSEELGPDQKFFTIIKKLPYEHEYTWPRWRQLLGGYRGQKQSFFLLEFVGQDSDFNFSHGDEVGEIKWIDKNDLTKYIHPARQEALRHIINFI